MKILLAGATGAVGRLLVPKLLDAGHEVVGLTRSSKRKGLILEMGAEAVVSDVFDRDAMKAVFSEVRPEVVIHQLTSLGARDFSENTRIRVQGTRNLVDAALQAGVGKIIAQSISWAYEPGVGVASEEVPLDVHAPMPRKTTVDGVISLERTVTEVPRHVILRYGIFYGPGTWYDRDGFVAQEVRSQRIPATEGVTSFIHVEDAASAARDALGWPSGPVNIVDDEPARGIDWLPVYASAIHAPEPEARLGSDRGERGASNAKARRDYGWRPAYPTWRTGMPQSLTPQRR